MGLDLETEIEAMSNILVMKFGGTSMGSAERIRVAARISAEQHAQRPVVIVVSAMSKVTDLLINSMRKAEAGDHAGLEANLAQLRTRHFEACRELLPAERQEACIGGIEAILWDIGRIARGMMMLAECPPRSIDEALAVGERLSALMMAEYLETQGIRAKAVNGADVIATDAVFGNATPLMPQTRERVSTVLKPMLDDRVLPVVTGFNASTLDRRPTTLGRGGSDFSASILASAIDAAELWIWTDVDGIMTGDPRLVSDARVLDEVTYSEAAELAYNGAKVLHPRTLAPLVESKIPVWSKNSFDLDKPGTRIVPHINEPRGPHAVTSMADVALVSIEPANSTLSGTKVMARALDALARENVEVLALTSSSYRQNF
jgi:aspartate kinase